MYVDDCVYDCSGRHAHGSALIKQVVRLRMLLNGSVRSSSANYHGASCYRATLCASKVFAIGCYLKGNEVSKSEDTRKVEEAHHN